MSEAEAKADLIMKGKTYASESIRVKTRAALISTLRNVEAIRDSDEEYENSNDSCRYNDSDGTPYTTIEKIEEEQDAKKNSLRKRSSEFFNFDDQLSDATNSGSPDVNTRLKWGYTLLHFAAIAGDEAECDRLIAAGADLTAVDNGGKMPFQKAALKGFNALAEKLKP